MKRSKIDVFELFCHSFEVKLVDAAGRRKIYVSQLCGVTILSKIGRSAGRRMVTKSAGRYRLLEVCLQMSVTQFTGESVEAARLRGVVQMALSSPEWGGPG